MLEFFAKFVIMPGVIVADKVMHALFRIIKPETVTLSVVGIWVILVVVGHIWSRKDIRSSFFLKCSTFILFLAIVSPLMELVSPYYGMALLAPVGHVMIATPFYLLHLVVQHMRRSRAD